MKELPFIYESIAPVRKPKKAVATPAINAIIPAPFTNLIRFLRPPPFFNLSISLLAAAVAFFPNKLSIPKINPRDLRK